MFKRITIFSVAALIAAVALLAVAWNGRTTHHLVHLSAQKMAAHAEPGQPTSLPAGATLAHETKDHGSIVREYALAGRANANTATAAAIAAMPKSASVHPATELTVYYIPGITSPDIPVDPTYFTISSVDVNGAHGQLAVFKTGLGAVRLDWVDSNGNYHVVVTDRMNTADGLSGVSPRDVLSIARSIGS